MKGKNTWTTIKIIAERRPKKKKKEEKNENIEFMLFCIALYLLILILGIFILFSCPESRSEGK